MSPKIRRLIPFLILILASLACATLSGGNSPVPIVDIPTVNVPSADLPTVAVPTVEVPGIVEPTPAGGETSPNTPSGADTLNLDDPAFYAAPEDINTYRASLKFSFSGQAEDGTAISDFISGDGAFSVDPPQMSFIFDTSSSDVPAGTIEIVQLDNTLYMSSADLGCFSLPVDESDTMDNPYEELLDTGGFLTGQATRVQPDDTINDIPVYVYEITTDNLDLTDPTAQEITAITFGRLYVAKEGGYVVGLVIDGRGKNTLGNENTNIEGDVHYEINYFDQNKSVEIIPPAACMQGDTGGGVAPGAFPVPDGATDLITLPGITSFSSAQTPEELSQYYKTEMLAAGWTMGDEINVTGLITLTFTKDGKTATVTITADPSTGNTQVAIFES